MRAPLATETQHAAEDDDDDAFIVAVAEFFGGRPWGTWHEAIQTSDQGVIGWNIASSNAFAGVNCPNCGSKLIGARHPLQRFA